MTCDDPKCVALHPEEEECSLEEPEIVDPTGWDDDSDGFWEDLDDELDEAPDIGLAPWKGEFPT